MPQHTSQHLIPTLACALALGCALLPGSAAAASPAPVPAAHDQTRPWVMKQTADAMAATDPGPLAPRGPVAPLRPRAAPALPGLAQPATAGSPPLSREVFAFANAGDLGNAGVGYRTWTFSLLSTVAYFGLHINAADGSIVTGDTGWNVWHSQTASDFINAAHAAGTKVVLGIIYQDTGPGMCTALDRGVQTAAAVNAQMLGADGLNIDYEGVNQTCPDGHSQREKVNAFTQAIRQRVPGYLSIDTYASSGGDTAGFFDIATLAGYVDSFFVMDYALETSNGPCAKCMGPTAPLAGYTWTVTRSADGYAPWAAKSILGFPYYGVKGCVTSTAPNAVVASPSNYAYEPYYLIASDPTDPKIHNWSAHVDGNDPVGQEKWATFYSDYTNCTRELYWDDATSLGLKYDLVNRRGFRGAGIFTLDYGGGAPELWNAISGHFSYAPALPTAIHACPGDGFAVVNWNAPASGGAPISSSTITASPGGASTTVGGQAQSGVVRGLTDGTPYVLGVQASNAYGQGPAGFSNTVTPVAAAGTWPGQFHPLTPRRVLDSRDGTGGVSGRLSPGQVVDVPMLGAGQIPAAGVAGVILNVTATDATGPGYLVAYATGSCQPLASNVNFGNGVTGTNLVTVALGAGGKVSFANGSGGYTNILADVAGWISTAPASSGTAGALRPLTPARIMDTRGGNPLYPGEGSAISLPVLGRGGIPGSGVAAIAINLTVVNPRGAGFVAAYPGATRWPGNSNVNFDAGETIPNRIVVPVGADGQVQFVSSVLTDVIADVGGWYTDASAAAGGGRFTGSTPVRILDTRDGTGGYGPAGPGHPFALQITGQPGVPASGVTAVVLNVTATDASAPSFITVYPSDVAWPLASDLNTAPGRTSANLVIARLSAGGQVSFINAGGNVNVIVDLVGWYG